MEYITGIEQYAGIEKTALTLGKFDGLHKGHQKLIDKICAYSGENCKSVLCAFDMHRESLMTKQERRSHLEGKIDCLIEYPFTKELREMEAEVFIKNILCEKLHAAHIVVGTDFAFGHEKRGNTEMLKMFSEKGGYTLDVIEKERYDQIVISSTYIRDVLSQGNVTLAAELLGYRYGVTGIVRHGRQLGRTLGFPTMNVEPEEKKILPRFGVYVCRINIDGKWYNGIGNVGVKPTVTEEHKRLVEVFVYDYEGDAYGKEITVEFCDFERPEIRFSSVNELKKQVAKDLRYGKDYCKASKEI